LPKKRSDFRVPISGYPIEGKISDLLTQTVACFVYNRGGGAWDVASAREIRDEWNFDGAWLGAILESLGLELLRELVRRRIGKHPSDLCSSIDRFASLV
jgi:hypothetical protein